jgi:hypothetical protein
MRLFWFVALFSLGLSRIGFSSSCHMQVNSSKSQYIVGYGSLMLESSKRDTYHSVGENVPILLNGYQRGWFARGLYQGHATTFLGASYKAHHNMNAVMFQVGSKIIASFDTRERNYCRYLVSASNIKWLSEAKDLTHAQVWIYLPSDAIRLKPSSENPIYQTYVDIFLQGCVELERKFHLKDFSKNCIIKTTDWSKNIKNDREKKVQYQTEINQLMQELK